MDSLIGKDPTVIRQYVLALFAALDRGKITWAVMRGWERLPDWTRYDIDILVARQEANNAVAIVKNVAIDTGWLVYGVLDMGDMRSVWMLRRGGDGHDYLRIDIETGNRYRGIEIHESQKYLGRRIWDKERRLWRMPDGYAGAAVLLKELAVKGRIDSPRRQKQVLSGVTDPQFDEIVSDSICDSDLLENLYSLLREENWSGIAKLSPQIRKRIFRRTPVNVLRMICYAFATARGLFSPFMRCLIVLVGPDGCGKTTIADAIAERFNGRPFQGLMRIHMLFGVPRMRSLKAALYRCFGKNLPIQAEPAPGTRHVGMQKPHSMLRAMAYVTYYGLGMIFGRIRLLLWRTQGGLVLADRFFQDYYYMRGYMKCPKWYVRMMEFFVPTPDLIISLERSAEDIYAQKPELDVAEIKREQEAIRRLLGYRNNARIVDAGDGVEMTVKRVNVEIEKWIEGRARCVIDNRYLYVRGQLWAAYPEGMRFPYCFNKCYPMRGGGKISRILSILNLFHLDWIITKSGVNVASNKRLPSLRDDEQVAFFWPAESRSAGRFYGYRVDNGKLVEYWKLATSADERSALLRELENTKLAAEMADGNFRVPSYIGAEVRDGIQIVRYDVLPPDARSVPMDDQWRERIFLARQVIARAGYQHGDFGWHNMKVSGDELWVLDWEEMSASLPKLVDEISFETMYQYYNQGVAIERVWEEIRKKYADRISEVVSAISSMSDRKIAMGKLLSGYIGGKK